MSDWYLIQLLETIKSLTDNERIIAICDTIIKEVSGE